MNTIKIKATDSKTQGDFVIINECDFDSKKHELYEVSKANKVRKTTKKK